MALNMPASENKQHFLLRAKAKHNSRLQSITFCWFGFNTIHHRPVELISKRNLRLQLIIRSLMIRSKQISVFVPTLSCVIQLYLLLSIILLTMQIFHLLWNLAGLYLFISDTVILQIFYHFRKNGGWPCFGLALAKDRMESNGFINKLYKQSRCIRIISTVDCKESMEIVFIPYTLDLFFITHKAIVMLTRNWTFSK